MRQVPHYLLIGNGRVAHHFKYYFTNLSLSFTCWHRNESIDQLHDKISQATHILLLIKDEAIEPFIKEHLLTTKACLIHFSGSLVSKLAFGAHPLMSFNQTAYATHQYRTIPFIIDEDAPAFDQLLPDLPNPHVRLSKSLKPKYHAYCVMSGNFSTFLWQHFFSTLTEEFKLPASLAHGYLQQSTQNLLTNPKAALTGPLTRGDQKTIRANLAALADDPLRMIYQSFITCYAKLQEKENEYT